MNVTVDLSDEVINQILVDEMKIIIDDMMACPPELREAAKIILADITP